MFKIIAIAFLVVFNFEMVEYFSNATIYEICMVAGTMSAIFGDISINTALDKFKKGENEYLNNYSCNVAIVTGRYLSLIKDRKTKKKYRN